MQKLAAIFISSFVIAFSGALMPGPLLSATIGESSRRGWMVGPLFIAGHGILELLLIIGLFCGLAPLLTSDIAFLLIAFAGSIFMVKMAYGMFRSLPSLSFSEQHGEKTKNEYPLPVTGALMSLANPYWIIWWATIGLGCILSSREQGAAGIAFFFAGHITADFVWYTFVSCAVYKGRTVIPDIVYRVLIGICAAFLCVFSLYLVCQGIIRFGG